MYDDDLLVVGAGAAGLMASAMAAQAGLRVLTLDSVDWLGGRLMLQTQLLQGPKTIYRNLTGVDFGADLVAATLYVGATLAVGNTVKRISPFDPPDPGFEVLSIPSRYNDAWAEDPDRVAEHAARLRVRAIVIATGSAEPWYDVPGMPPNGAALSGEVQEALTRRDEVPGLRVVMLGSDNAGLLIAQNLMDAGVEVVAVVDESPAVVGREVNAAPLREAGVELLTATRVVEAHGGESLESVTVETNGARRTLRADFLCMAGPRSPDVELASQLGIPVVDLPIMGGRTPAHDASMAAPVPGVFVCGDAAGVENGAVALESGRLAGLAAAAYLGRPHPDTERLIKLARGRLAYLRRGRRGRERREAKALAAVALATSPPS